MTAELVEQQIYSIDPEEESIKQQGEKSNTSNLTLLLDIVKQLKPGTEIYKVALPAYVLQPISFLEKMSVYSTPSNILLPLFRGTIHNPSDRLIRILAWLLSTWRSVPRQGFQSVKPYNPVLGEHFHCAFKFPGDDCENDETEYHAEQVSHHPPVTAFMMRNTKGNFCYRGHVYPKTSFSFNSFTTIMDGKFVIEYGLGENKEIYYIRQPNVVCSGVVVGSTTIKIADDLVIASPTSPFKAKIQFTGTHHLDGYIYNGERKLYRVSGKVNEVVHIKDLTTNHTAVLYDCVKIVKPMRFVKPLSEQADNESQRNWHKVTVALRKGDYEEANKQKFQLEERERRKAKAQKEKGAHYEPHYFKLSPTGDDWKYVLPCSGANSDAVLAS